MFDNDTATFYASRDQGVDTYLDFDFSTPTAINGFDMTQRNDIARVLTSSLIFDDNSDFSSPLATVSLTHTNSPLAYNSYSFATVVARYVRWDVTSVNDTFYLSNGAAEMTFYGPGPTPSVPAPATILAAPAFASAVLRLRRLRRRSRQVNPGKTSLV